jgi:glycosyltransferase involved in cell wall biosynthesis
MGGQLITRMNTTDNTKSRCDKKRILQVNIDNNGGNGAFSLVYNLYELLCDKYIFDFFTMGNFIASKEATKIQENGGQVYSGNLRQSRLLGHILLPFYFYRFLKTHKYDIVHIHSEVAYKHFLYALPARLAGTPKIIIHSHSNNVDGDKRQLKRIFHHIFKPLVCTLGTDFIAISPATAVWMFSKKVRSGDHFHYLTNGINPHKYIFNDSIRKNMRDKLNISNDKIVIGHVGSLKKVKNQQMLIRLLSYCNSIENKYELFLVGDGNDYAMLRELAVSCHQVDNIHFLGSRDDVADILQAMDVFCFPSFFEGVPMSLIEAQAAGVPVIASENISRDIKVNENVEFLPIGKNYKEWKMHIDEDTNKHLHERGCYNIAKSRFNINNSASKLNDIYKD